MSSIYIGVGLLVMGFFYAIPVLTFSLAFLIISVKNKKDICLYFGQMMAVYIIAALTIGGLLDENLHVSFADFFSRFNLIPVLGQWDDWKLGLSGNTRELVQFIGNIGFFIPFGFLYQWIRKKDFKHCVLVGMFFSICIEVVQCLAGRSGDIDDVLMNTLGMAVGYYICTYGNQVYGIFGKKKTQFRGKGRIEKWFSITWMILNLLLIARIMGLGMQ